MYRRISNPLLSNSFFLFGGRGTGKSTLLKAILPPDTLWFDLLQEDLANDLLANPERFLARIKAEQRKRKLKWIAIDEVQRVPGLLNYVHSLIEDEGLFFALTGSSARKLKRGQANLLAGRAFTNTLHPLTYLELDGDFSIDAVLNWGSIPKVCSLTQNELKQEFLRSYVNTYLKEEIKEEQLVRKLAPFVRFLEIAAQSNGTVLNFAKIARDCGTDSPTIERYFEILQDTYLGFMLTPFHESIRKRQVHRSKFYFFDLGVKRALEGLLTVPVSENGTSYGRAFEHFFILECLRMNDYFRKDFRFSYLRTKDDLEIDLIVERPGKSRILIELKSSQKISVHPSDYRGLTDLSVDIPNSETWIVSQQTDEMQLGKLRFLHWQAAMQLLFDLAL